MTKSIFQITLHGAVPQAPDMEKKKKTTGKEEEKSDVIKNKSV